MAANATRVLRLTARCEATTFGPKPSYLAAHGAFVSRGRITQLRSLTGQTGPPSPSPTPNSVDDTVEHINAEDGRGGKNRSEHDWKGTAFKMIESALTTAASISILGLVGYSYTRWYKYHVLQKMENAFKPGDPVLDLTERNSQDPPPAVAGHHPPYDNIEPLENWIPRDEQAKINAIVTGEDKRGHYYLIIGEKGTGKTSMLIQAMSTKDEGEGVAMFDAHADLEIFRVRLGKALDFEYHEDNIGSLFSIRGPRDASALLDIERAFNKLEKVALKRRKTKGKPLVLIINSVHLLRDDEDGRDLLELIQQRAESWAAANLATVIFNSDDYWVYERLKQYATRMEIMPIGDLPKKQATDALRKYRKKYFPHEDPEKTTRDLEEVYNLLGGRLTFLNRCAKHTNMIDFAKHICQLEKTWFLNKCWILGEEMDDDVMDQQKYASAAMVLARALVEQGKEMKTYDPEEGHKLPEIPLHKAREIMTRADFIQDYDHINVFTIDSHAMVRADSVAMQHAFEEVCSAPGFDEFLEATLERISAIESLGRTREITVKDLWNQGKYNFTTTDHKGRLHRLVSMETVQGKKEDSEEEG